MSLTDSTIQHIRETLEKEKAKQEKTLASLLEQDPYSHPDRLSDKAASDMEASEESSHERMEALEKALHQKITDITDALQRIEAGSYGMCLSCKNPIAEQRLSVTPTALLCVTCEQKKQQ